MIVCGIIQSPQRDSDLLIVRQTEGESQSPDSVINAKINLTANGSCINSNGIKGWCKNKIFPKEIYISATTKSQDSLGRPILLGIYLKKEGKEVSCISDDLIVKLLNEFSLEMDEVVLNNVVSFVKNYFTGSFLRRNLFCSTIICSIIFLIAIVFFMLVS